MDIIAGLICDNAELFGAKNSNYTIIGGKVVPLQESPKALLDAIDNSMDQDDHQCLEQIMNITDPMEKRNQWATCNLSTLDNVPDFSPGQKILIREYVQCPYRGKCSCEGRLCRTLSQITRLTPKQLEYLHYTNQGLLDKEIADKMGIKTETARSHSQNIRITTGLARKADLVRFAQKLNLNSHINDSITTSR